MNAPRLGVAEAVLIGVLLALFPRTFVVELVQIPSSSMEPSLVAGDLVLVNRFAFASSCSELAPWLPCRSPGRGDVILVRAPDDPHQSLVKRVIATGGTVVDFVDKKLWLDEQPATDPWAHHVDPMLYPDAAFVPDERRVRDQHGPTRVPPLGLFLVGDNRDHSWDSRYWGPVSQSLVQGRPWLVVWRDGRPHLRLVR